MKSLPPLTPRLMLAAMAAMAATLIASGFVLEHGFGVRPCPMCWWQRYAHMAILAFGLLGTFKTPRLGAAGVALAALAGGFIAAWQSAAQHNWLPFPPSCSSHGAEPTALLGADLLTAMAQVKVIPCDVETFTLFGLSLANWNLPLMILAAGVGVKILLQLRHP